MPTLYPYRDFVEARRAHGMAYSVDVLSLTRHAAHQVDQILKGAAPGEVPFFQATKYQLSINLKTAKELGITIPPSLLERAVEAVD